MATEDLGGPVIGDVPGLLREHYASGGYFPPGGKSGQLLMATGNGGREWRYPPARAESVNLSVAILRPAVKIAHGVLPEGVTVEPAPEAVEALASALDAWRADLEAQCMKALLCGAEPHNPTTYARSDIESPGMFNWRWWRKST